MSKVVFIEKYSPNCRFWQNLIKKNKTPLPLEIILERYKGFEGELVKLIFCENLDFNVMECVNKYASNLKYDDVVFVSEDESRNNLINNRFQFLGYDFGVCEPDKTLYSSIFNEILFGTIEVLIKFQESLNENLLFPYRSDVEDYAHYHEELLHQEKDVERETMKVYEIWNLHDSK